MAHPLASTLTLLLGLAAGGLDPAAHLGPLCEAPPLPAELVQLDLPPAPLPHGIELLVSPESVLVGYGPASNPADSPAALLTELSAAAETARLLERPTRDLRLLIAPDTPAFKVGMILGVAHGAGFETGHVVVYTQAPASFPDYPDEAYAAELQGRLAGVAPDRRAMIVAQEVEDLLKRCPPGLQVFEAVAAATPETRCAMLARGLSEALPQCRRTNGARVLTAVQHVVQPEWTHQPASFPLPLDTSLPLDLELPWAELAPRLVPTAP